MRYILFPSVSKQQWRLLMDENERSKQKSAFLFPAESTLPMTNWLLLKVMLILLGQFMPLESTSSR